MIYVSLVRGEARNVYKALDQGSRGLPRQASQSTDLPQCTRATRKILKTIIYIYISPNWFDAVPNHTCPIIGVIVFFWEVARERVVEVSLRERNGSQST